VRAAYSPGNQAYEGGRGYWGISFGFAQSTGSRAFLSDSFSFRQQATTRLHPQASAAPDFIQDSKTDLSNGARIADLSNGIKTARQTSATGHASRTSRMASRRQDRPQQRGTHRGLLEWHQDGQTDLSNGARIADFSNFITTARQTSTTGARIVDFSKGINSKGHGGG